MNFFKSYPNDFYRRIIELLVNHWQDVVINEEEYIDVGFIRTINK